MPDQIECRMIGTPPNEFRLYVVTRARRRPRPGRNAFGGPGL